MSKVHVGPFCIDATGKRILQCHSRGYKEPNAFGREVPLFSPFGVTLKYDGFVDSLENLYMMSKCFDRAGNDCLQYGFDWKEAGELQRAGKRIKAWHINHSNANWLPPKYPGATMLPKDEWGVQFYIALWLAFLRTHEGQRRLAIAAEYDEYEDPFAGTFPFGQDCVIRQAVREGVESLAPLCAEIQPMLLPIEVIS